MIMILIIDFVATFIVMLIVVYLSFHFKDANSLVELIMELGYSFTSSVEECRTALASLGAREISPTCAAHILSHMTRSCNILDDPGGLQTFWGNSAASQDSNKEKSSETTTPTTWNIEVFIQALKEIVSLCHIFIMFIIFIMSIILSIMTKFHFDKHFFSH